MLPVEDHRPEHRRRLARAALGFEEGRKLKAPIVELCYKDDDLDDPMLNWYHFRELGVADEDLAFCEELGLRVNEILVPSSTRRRRPRGLQDRGRTRRERELMLADEISPDTCRFWDKETGEKLDKDRFRRDMGGVEEAYAEMLRRVTEIKERGAVD
jgi:phosphoribosylaminoimidazole-succinocarboxamide synthase